MERSARGSKSKSLLHDVEITDDMALAAQDFFCRLRLYDWLDLTDRQVLLRLIEVLTEAEAKSCVQKPSAHGAPK
jgi:hypothetical protein